MTPGWTAGPSDMIRVVLEMNGVLLSLVMTAAIQSPPAPADEPPGPGISRALAEDRARRIRDLRYDLDLTVPASPSERLTGRLSIRFTLRDASRPLALDFGGAGSVKGAAVAGTPTELLVARDHLVVPSSALREGANEIAIEFLAGDAALNRNPEFLYTLFVPARAHLAIPCFDQPDLKARWTLALDMPEAWEAVSNGAEVSRSTAGGRRRLRFAETPPLPTYLFAFGAGRFSMERAERNGRTFRLLHRETDAEKVARNREAIFDLHAAALEWLERYTGLPYPWGKFDFLLLPSFQFGGMEHAGAIYYNAAALFLDPSATQHQQLNRAHLIAHETAHMWFGDLVTMRWFDDVWMKEVFANFMAAKIVNPAFPEIDHELRFLYDHFPDAYDIDRTPGTNAIRQPLDNLNEAGTLYGAIIYKKAPIVMRQLELMLGETAFQQGLQQYLRRHAFANATWLDLIALLDQRTSENLFEWSRAWVEEAGRPIVTTELRVEDGRIAALAFAQRDPAARRGLVWNQRLRVAIGTSQGIREFPVHLDRERVEVDAAIGLPEPHFVLPSGDGFGYGGFELDQRTIAYLSAHLPDIEDPLTRGAAWLTLWEQMLDGRVTPSEVVALAIRALPRETDEQKVQRILGWAEEAFWRFLTASERAAVAPVLERVLREGLDAATASSRKSAWFSTLRDVAHAPAVLAWLERIWRGTEEVPGLTLAEPDYITLALELAVRDVPAWKDILDGQQARTGNPDRRARFEFVRPALSPDQRVRDAFFESLTDVTNRRHEPWVLEALSYLHHPLRAEASARYVPASLEMLREIQRTGDIFFPKRWTDATLGGHSSTRVAGMVKAFLAGLPEDYPDRLRRIVLSSSDKLFRASGMAR
ncbi:MAG TPA: M1 family aminopeptidase [Vicinamibacterales bacterium]|nr:M1 family aminopeptidase [Vicinamibacterales bacterium]